MVLSPEGVAVHGEGAARPAAEGRAEFGREFVIRRPERVRIEMSGRGTDRLECLRARSRGVVHILGPDRDCDVVDTGRSEEHTSELQSLMRISYAVFCLKKKKHL